MSLEPLRENSWLSSLPPRRDAARVRLFCVPFAGSSGHSAFRRWGELLPEWIEVCVVELPGHPVRSSEPLLRRMAPLIADLGPATVAWLDLPFAFFGYSLGGFIAYEWAHWLAEHGHPQPIGLLVGARASPQAAKGIRPDIYRLPDDLLIEALMASYGLPAGLRSSPRALAEYLPIIRADTELLCTYAAVPRPLLGMPIVAFTGSTDSLTPLAGVHAWREQTRGDFSVETFDGGHFFIQGASGEALRERIVSHLARLSGHESQRAPVP